MSTASPRLHARIAGLLYLIVVITSVFALVTTSALIVRGDAGATAANILASEQTFRLAFAANLVAAAAYVGVVAILYELLKPVNATLSVVAAFLGLAGCAISGASMVNTLATLHFLGDTSYLRVLDQGQTHALALTSLKLGGIGNSIGLVFFGFYCTLLGCLVLRSTFLPKTLGVLLIVAGVGWLVGSFTDFLAPSLSWSSYLIPVSGLGELVFTLWLMILGVNEARWREQAGTK